MGKPQLVLADTSARSSEREHLAAAIVRHNAAVELLVRIKTAISHADESLFATLTALTAAEATAVEAEAGEADFLVSKALGETDAASPATIAAAEIERAKADRDVIRNTLAALAEREKSAAAEIEWSKSLLDAAVKAVLRSETSASVTTMMSKAKVLQAELVDLRVRLRYLLHGDSVDEAEAQEVKDFLHEYMLPATYNCKERENYSEHPAADGWRAACEALKVDADAPLPI
jgi:hypothetical protein